MCSGMIDHGELRDFASFTRFEISGCGLLIRPVVCNLYRRESREHVHSIKNRDRQINNHTSTFMHMHNALYIVRINNTTNLVTCQHEFNDI